DAVTAKMSEVKVTQVGKVEFREGQLQDEKIVIALSGVGKVNAAMASTLMCHLYPIDALLSIGVAGGLQDEQEVGDLVISDHAIQVDYDTSALDGQAGIGLKFDADEDLVNRAKLVAQKTNLKWRVGTIATQDLFLASKEDYNYLMSRFPHAACNEMEGASVA
ncbi:MTA/SAH nucleosidase, partial [gut metagenome]